MFADRDNHRLMKYIIQLPTTTCSPPINYSGHCIMFSESLMKLFVVCYSWVNVIHELMSFVKDIVVTVFGLITLKTVL